MPVYLGADSTVGRTPAHKRKGHAGNITFFGRKVAKMRGHLRYTELLVIAIGM